jgi:hypothetical protein
VPLLALLDLVHIKVAFASVMVKAFFYDRVKVAKELLQQMNARHHLKRKVQASFLPAGARGAIKASKSLRGVTATM